MMSSIIKMQLQHRYLRKIIVLIILATICFGLCSVYLNSDFVQNLSLNSSMQLLINNIYISYLSLTASSGILGYFSFNGLVEDKAIFMSLIARKVNIFYLILGKILVSLIYSLLPTIVAFVISVYYFHLSLIYTLMIIINAYLLFYIIYFLTYIINGEKNFDIVLAYALVLISFITAIIDANILFFILLPIVIIILALLYRHANEYIVLFIFSANDTLFDCIRCFGIRVIRKFIYIIVNIFSMAMYNYRFLALLKRDLLSLMSFIPKMYIVYLSFIFVHDYKMIVIICYEMMVFQFLRKIIIDDSFIIKVNLISSKEYIVSKSTILILINLVIQYSLSYYYPMNLSLLMIQSFMLIALVIGNAIYISLKSY